MDKQPLNTGEQKDMAEFFTDLLSKLEEMDSNLVNIFNFIYLSQSAFDLVKMSQFKHSLFSARNGIVACTPLLHSACSSSSAVRGLTIKNEQKVGSRHRCPPVL